MNDPTTPPDATAKSAPTIGSSCLDYMRFDQDCKMIPIASMPFSLQPCGHVGLPSVWPSEKGESQCTECANKMRGV